MSALHKVTPGVEELHRQQQQQLQQQLQRQLQLQLQQQLQRQLQRQQKCAPHMEKDDTPPLPGLSVKAKS
jgi:hypothetical protein